MALFRALSTSRSRRGGYDRLLDETTSHDSSSAFTAAAADPDQVVLKRVTSVPARILFGSSSKKLNVEPGFPLNKSKSKHQQQQQQQQQQGTKKSGKAHPVFSLFEGRWKKKKMTANPDFSRYMQYLKEGGVWDKEADSPVIYYK